MTARQTGSSEAAVPRSGWRMISRNGTASTSPPASQLAARHCWRQAVAYSVARLRASTTRLNSDGCRLNGPSAIQRWPPPRAMPNSAV